MISVYFNAIVEIQTNLKSLPGMHQNGWAIPLINSRLQIPINKTQFTDKILNVFAWDFSIGLRKLYVIMLVDFALTNHV